MWKKSGPEYIVRTGKDKGGNTCKQNNPRIMT